MFNRKRWTQFICLLSMIISSNHLNAAIASADKNDVFEMKRKIQEQARSLIQISKEVGNIEYTLALQNKKYTNLASERAKLEESLSQAKKNADFDEQTLKKSFNETKSLLLGILLNKLEKTETASDMLSKKILVESLRRKLVDLDGVIKENKLLKDDLERTYLRLEDSMKTEKELLTLMNELELKKKELNNNLQEINNQKKLDEDKFNETKNKMAMERFSERREKLKEKLSPVQITEEIKVPSQNSAQISNNKNEKYMALPGEDYQAPLLAYQGMEYNKKGITFSFQGKNEIHAPKGGKVVYTGSLANYGNVIMINHGAESKTVLFGQFDYVVKNGDSISANQIIGYTNPKKSEGLGEGKVYFEVRKNNLAQNTYLLLDKNTLKQH